MHTLRLGDLEITALTEIDSFDIPLTTLLPDADPKDVAQIPWLSLDALSDGILHLKIRAWLLRLKGRVILIDTCVGAHKNRPARPDWHLRSPDSWNAALASANLRADDVDVVMCTHLHADHAGWNTKLVDGRWVPTFPNARYICARSEYAFWEGEIGQAMDRYGVFADSVLPVMEAGAMDLVDDGFDLGNGLVLQATPGHTPGHMCVHVAHGPGAVFAGDALHSPLQLALPHLSSAFCADPDTARHSRQNLLSDVADTGKWLIPAHFPDPGWTRIRQDGEGFCPRN